MPRRRLRRRRENAHRHAPPAGGAGDRRVVVREVAQVERLAYTQPRAAEALGVSRSTFNRRVLPLIETVQMDWGTRLVPVDELERLLAARRQRAQAAPAVFARPGRRTGLPPEVVARIRDEQGRGKSLAEIARGLDADDVRTAQGGCRWWPSTVRAVLIRSKPPGSAWSPMEPPRGSGPAGATRLAGRFPRKFQSQCILPPIDNVRRPH